MLSTSMLYSAIHNSKTPGSCPQVSLYVCVRLSICCSLFKKIHLRCNYIDYHVVKVVPAAKAVVISPRNFTALPSLSIHVVNAGIMLQYKRSKTIAIFQRDGFVKLASKVDNDGNEADDSGETQGTRRQLNTNRNRGDYSFGSVQIVDP